MAEQEQTPVDEPADIPPDEYIDTEIAAGFDRDNRAMIRTLGTLIEASVKPRESAMNARVALAMDWMLVAACERVARICRSDLGVSESASFLQDEGD